MHQWGSPCCGSLECMSENYGSMVTPVGPSDVDKIAELVFLHVFKIAFIASLFQKLKSPRTKDVPKLYYRAPEKQPAEIPYGQSRGPGSSWQPWLEVSTAMNNT